MSEARQERFAAYVEAMAGLSGMRIGRSRCAIIVWVC